jgi:hypothetical protein
VTQQELRDDTGRDCDQNVVAALLDPLISLWRRVEVVTAPVIDHVVPVAVFGRQPIPAVILVVRARAAAFAAFLFMRASEVAPVVLVAVAMVVATVV